MFAPSLNQIVRAAVHNGGDGFDNLRSATKAIRGIDVSHYNGTIDWGRVSDNNVKFAYIKATQSSTYVDNTFEKNWEGAKAAEVPRGAYHVFSFCRDAQAQFGNIAKHIPQDDSALPIALDLLLVKGQETSQFKWQADEGKCAITLRPDGIRDRIKDLSQLIASKYGRQPILYGGNYMLDDILSKSFTDGFTLWRGTPGIAQSPPPPWSIWQYSTNESVPGINEPVDVDVLSAKGE
jgi:lysozyme